MEQRELHRSPSVQQRNFTAPRQMEQRNFTPQPRNQEKLPGVAPKGEVAAANRALSPNA